MSDRRVVVTGMGVVTPLGCTVETFWDNLIACKSGITPVDTFDCSQFDVRIGGACSDFDPTIVIDPKAARRMDRFSQMALLAAHEAVRQSGIDFNRVDAPRVGCIIGSGIGGIKELEDQYARLLQKGPGKVSAFTIPKLMVNAAAGNLSIAFGAKGPSQAVSTACASASNAVGDAMEMIRRNQADVILAGGSEAALTPLGLSAFAAMKALSTRNDDPAAASRPFDRGRDGFVLSEGAGVFVLEELSHAEKRGALILAEVAGFGSSADAEHLTQPHEDGEGAIQAMQAAIKDAHLSPQDIDYINAHGTATPLGDVAEACAINRVFGPAADRIAVSSTKSSIGHLLGASGAVELVASIMAIRGSVAPPTINLDDPDERCAVRHVANRPQDMRITRVISNSFGFGGHNACIVVSKFP
ncbi:MAG: beta-ketoacyl-ACP synthase II [Phycisphaerales bacterium]|nr:MAG: beta-ketoacyl-ACP synthase II [Phycisphaerales bacterium]